MTSRWMIGSLAGVALLCPSLGVGADKLQAMTQEFCVSCHNPEDWAGQLDLESIDHDHVAAEPEAWEKVVVKLRAGMMPPPGKPRPSRLQVESLTSWLESSLDAAPGQSAPLPALHRLNRTEYANAIRDLFGMQVDVGSLLPVDDASNGFDNMAAGLSISPALIQGYVTAAMKLSRAAVGDMTATDTTTIYQAPATLAQDEHLEGLPLGSRGGMRVVHNFPLDAEYHFSVRGGFSLDRNPGVRVDVAIDGERIEARSIRDFRLPVKAGAHVVTAALFDLRRSAGVNDIYSVYKPQGQVESIEIAGPFNATGPGDTESRRRIFSCRPASEAQNRSCAQKILIDVASRAFREPQRLEDLAAIMPFFDRGLAAGGFERGVEQALSRILIDPRFLFRMEGEGGDIALASRLSFFLWSSIPDQELIAHAVKGTLHRPEVLSAQVRRMLADERSSALVDNFAGQWLFLRQLATVTPEVEGFDENLRDAFIDETRALVAHVLRQDRPVTELLTADYTFLNERLARHYGIAGVRGSHLRKVSLPPETHRRGLLGHGSILTITSTASRTSPVIRGSWILENLLGSPPPAPPPGVETNIDGDGTKVLTTSVRQRLEVHRANPSCASCHGVIDPVGFALENFNPIGAWRDRDGDSLVDARGTLVDGTAVSGPEDLTAALSSRSQMFISHVTQKLLAYSLGRTLDHRDMPAVRAIVRQAGRRQYSLAALVEAVALSDPFLQRGVAAPAGRVVARQ